MHDNKSRIFTYRRELFLFLVLLFFRLPFFFRDYMDHDESTFILMGQSVADGYLPYDRLWDLKPPLLFYLFGLVEWIFPHSLLAIRVFGFLTIFISLVWLLRIAKAAGLRNPLLIAFSYAVLSSLFGSVQGVMSEHLAVMFMLAAVLFILRKQYFGAGLLLGAAVMCKMNYAYVIPALTIYLIIRREEYRPVWKKLFWLATGTALTFLLVALPYIVQGKSNLFTASVFLAPFEYGQAAALSVAFKLKKTWWIIVAAVVIAGATMRKASVTHREIAAIAALILLMTVYTFYSSGTVNGHYLIQVYPFIAILVLGVLAPPSKLRIGHLAVVALAISAESWIEYSRVARHINETGTAFNGKSRLAIAELKKRGLADRKIFFADYHIGYWFLRQYPLTKSTTHPSSLKRPFFFRYFENSRKTSMEELVRLFEEVQPEVIVSRNQHLSFFVEGSPENEYFKSITESRYVQTVSDVPNRIYIWTLKAMN